VFDCVAVVGATGAVGAIIRKLLEVRQLPHKRMKFVASKRSAGTKIAFAGRDIVVDELKGEVFDDVDLVISSTPDDIARDYIPDAVRRGCVVIDESGTGAWTPTFLWLFRKSTPMPSVTIKASLPAPTAQPRKWSKH
jgi:aspartate-semialdehyde dehydrogenase